MFCKLIQLIEINIRKKLTGNIAEWQPFSFFFLKTCKNNINQPQRIVISNFFPDELA